MAIEWKDESSYSRDDKKREPRVWAATVTAGFRICVARQHGLDPDEWFLICDPWFKVRSLGKLDIEAAKLKAVALVALKLQTALLQLEINRC